MLPTLLPATPTGPPEAEETDRLAALLDPSPSNAAFLANETLGGLVGENAPRINGLRFGNTDAAEPFTNDAPPPTRPLVPFEGAREARPKAAALAIPGPDMLSLAVAVA